MWTAIFITIDLGFGSTVLQGPPFSILRCSHPSFPIHPPSMIFFFSVWSFLVWALSVSFLSPATTDTADAELNSPYPRPISAAPSTLRGQCHAAFDYLVWYCRKLQLMMQYICWGLLCTSRGKSTQRVWCVSDNLQHTQGVGGWVSSFCFIQSRF